MLDDLDFYLILVTKPLEKLGLPLFFVNNSFFVDKIQSLKNSFSQNFSNEFSDHQRKCLSNSPCIFINFSYEKYQNTVLTYLSSIKSLQALHLSFCVCECDFFPDHDVIW